jgi:hypothetical protein
MELINEEMTVNNEEATPGYCWAAFKEPRKFSFYFDELPNINSEIQKTNFLP